MMVRGAARAATGLLHEATASVRGRVTVGGSLVGSLLDREQRAAHGLAWLATTVEAVRQLADYAERLQESGRFGETEELIVRIGAGEYLAQIVSGIAMSQSEIVRARPISACRRRRSPRMSRRTSRR